MRSARSRATTLRRPWSSPRRAQCSRNSTIPPGITRSPMTGSVSRLLPHPLPLELAEPEALDLAGLGARQVRDELDRPRVLVGCDLRLGEILDVLDEGV